MSEANEVKGYALRVGSEVWVAPNATDADLDVALEMMTPEERKQVARRFCRDLKWTVWQLKHPLLTAILSAGYECGLAVLGYRG